MNIFCFYVMRKCKSLCFIWQISGVWFKHTWVVTVSTVVLYDSSSIYFFFLFLFWVFRHQNPTGQVPGFMPHTSEELWPAGNHKVEQFCPSSSLSHRQWCSCLWLNVPVCGLGNQAERYMNFNKHAPLSIHSPTCLSQFCFWMEQLMCTGCVKPWAARIWV